MRGIIRCSRLLANIVSGLLVMMGVGAWFWKRSYHYHASIGPVRIRHHRSIPCCRVDLWALELGKVLKYALSRGAVEVPSLLFTVKEKLPLGEDGTITFGRFDNGPPLEVQLAAWPEGKYRKMREYNHTLAHETDHLLWWLRVGKVDCSLPYEDQPHEISARRFATSYVKDCCEML